MSELVLINHYEGSCGISVSKDMVVVARVAGESLAAIKIYAHDSLRSLALCPYAFEFRPHLVQYGDQFNLARVVEDAIRHSTKIGFDPDEMSLPASPRAVAVRKSPALNLVLRWMDDPKVEFWRAIFYYAGIQERKGVWESQRILKYYWESLRSGPDGFKTYDRASDRTEPIRAILNALAAAGVLDHLIREDAERREREKYNHLITDQVRAFAKRHHGEVKIRHRGRNAVEWLPLKTALPLVGENRAAWDC